MKNRHLEDGEFQFGGSLQKVRGVNRVLTPLEFAKEGVVIIRNPFNQ